MQIVTATPIARGEYHALANGQIAPVVAIAFFSDNLNGRDVTSALPVLIIDGKFQIIDAEVQA